MIKICPRLGMNFLGQLELTLKKKKKKKGGTARAGLVRTCAHVWFVDCSDEARTS
jgi:hypothetical protein